MDAVISHLFPYHLYRQMQTSPVWMQKKDAIILILQYVEVDGGAHKN